MPAGLVLELGRWFSFPSLGHEGKGLLLLFLFGLQMHPDRPFPFRSEARHKRGDGHHCQGSAGRSWRLFRISPVQHVGGIAGGKGVAAGGYGQELLAFSRFMRYNHSVFTLSSCQQGICHLRVCTGTWGERTVRLWEETGLGYRQRQRGLAGGLGKKSSAVPGGGLGFPELALAWPAPTERWAREEIPE